MSDFNNLPDSTILEMRSQLDAIKRVNPRTNVEYWTARDLKEKLGYDTWENFHAALHRAMDSCMVSGEAVSRHFRETTKMIAAGNGASRQVVDYFLTKNAAHCVRLLRMAGEYLRTGELIVHRPDADELLEIKRGKWGLSRVKAHADELFAGMRGARDTSPLPEEPDRQAAEALLVKIVRESVEKATEGAAQ